MVNEYLIYIENQLSQKTCSGSTDRRFIVTDLPNKFIETTSVALQLNVKESLQ